MDFGLFLAGGRGPLFGTMAKSLFGPFGPVDSSGMESDWGVAIRVVAAADFGRRMSNPVEATPLSRGLSRPF